VDKGENVELTCEVESNAVVAEQVAVDNGLVKGTRDSRSLVVCEPHRIGVPPGAIKMHSGPQYALRRTHDN
jgi:hypothetical protein